MNALLTTPVIITLLLFMQQCGKEDVAKGVPDCIQNKIREISAEGVRNPPAKVYSYFYNDRKVYFIPQHCCDIPSQLFDEECNLICTPDGGFSGSGDGKCKDFFSTRTQEMLIWEDARD